MKEEIKKFNVKTKEELDKALEWCKENPKKVAAGVVIVALGTTVVVLGIKNHKLRKACEALVLENEGLKDAIRSKDLTIKNQKIRIINLESLCSIKDNYYLKAISDSLRHGSSLGGQQMAFRREALKGMVS